MKELLILLEVSQYKSIFEIQWKMFLFWICNECAVVVDAKLFMAEKRKTVLQFESFHHIIHEYAFFIVRNFCVYVM